MGSFFDELKKQMREADEREKARAKDLTEAFVPGMTFVVAKNFKARLMTKSAFGNKMKDGGKHWISPGGERNITFLRHESGKLIFSVRWGIGKNYWEMALSEREAREYLIPEGSSSGRHSSAQADSARGSASTADQLREMKALLDEGVISAEEFEKFKASILG